MFVTLDRQIGKLDKGHILILAVLGILAVSLVDYLTGHGLSFAFFYLGPVALAAWYAGRSAGIAVSVVACLAWYLAEINSEFALQHPAIPVWNALVRFGFFLTNALLLASLHRHLIDEKRLARTDAMTGVLNSRAFSEQLDASLCNHRRATQGLTLAYVDLDDFKNINDTLGHTEGDRVLRDVAQTLHDNCRKTDVVARLGGDEFALLLPHTDLQGAAKLMGDIKTQLDHLSYGAEARVSCSIGAVVFERTPASASAAVRAADHLMYQVKRQGKNAVAFGVFDPETGEAVPHAAPKAQPQATGALHH